MQRSAGQEAMPDGWQRVRLGDVLKLEYGVSLPERKRSSGEIPVIGSAGVVGYHNQATNDGPGIVIGRKGSIGSVTWVGENFVPIDTTYFAVPIDGKLDLHWAYHFLSREGLSKLNRATGIPGLNRDDVYALNRHIPPLPEQRAIAAVLDSIDDAIEGAEAVIAATEQLRDSLLHDLLTRGLPSQHTEWRDVPGLGTIPADWDVVRLGDVATVQTGRAVNKGSRADGVLEVAYLSVANVKDGYLDLGVVKTMRVSESEIRRYGLRNGDVLFTEGGDADKLGRGTVWKEEIPLCLHQNHVFAVRPEPSLLMSEFLSAFAASGFGKRYFLGAAKQTTNLASVNSSQLKQMTLALPNIREQDKIVGALSAMGVSVQEAAAERNHLQMLKGSTAEALITGRLHTEGRYERQ